MKKIFAKNAAFIGVVGTGCFAFFLIWYAPQSTTPVPVVVYWVGGIAVMLMSVSLWSSLN
jgi:hypothetical protein